ncbi:MAG: TIGR03960 family B12-binding radical SAM protein [Syntrophobacteraceae bacterium]|nr:TIGR03960 family B12-binding radical SAM protein [Syntrophobacteraceae bacterium]
MFDQNLTCVERPGRYIGQELNAYNKSFEDASVRFALAFPDVYEIGMSHLGLKLLYRQLNEAEGVMADRVYAPWPDFEEKLRRESEPLRGIECEHALSDFDFLGVSLQYELSYTNILTMLDLGRIPLYSRERTVAHPFVVGGGPCAFNPEPLADFFDFFVLGEAEEVLPEIIGAYRAWKSAGGGLREGFLEALRAIPGVYVPSFFAVSYFEGGEISAVMPKFSNYTRVVKRVVQDFDRVCPIPENPLVPIIDIVHNRLGIEIARGCTRGCRFCQAGFIYRPVRERGPGYVIEAARKALAASGFEDVALLSLSTGDYCRIQELLAQLVGELAPRRIGVSFPSMRVGTLTPELMAHVKKVRKTGFTLAPEAGSERLRRVINKGICDSDLLDAAGAAFDMGWRLIKLYFMMGLPGETEADRQAIVDLCMRVRERGKKTKSSINVSISTFVPKPLSPFQWSAQMEGGQIEECIRQFKDRLRKPGLRFKWNKAGSSILEAVFARGDRRLGAALKRAWDLGARFDGWTDHFREDLWQRALEETGLSARFFAERQRSPEEILPWDHLSAGVDRSFLWSEYEKAMGEQFTGDCRQGSCSVCGVCDHAGIAPFVHKEVAPFQEKPGNGPISCGADKEFVYRVIYSKLGKARFFGQLEIAAALERALRRADLQAAFSKGFNPHPRISFGEALPLGMETIVAEAYIGLSERIDTALMRERLNGQLNGLIRISVVERIEKKPAPHPATRGVYLVSGLEPSLARALLDIWPRSGATELTKKTKRGEATARLDRVVMDMRKGGESSLEMDVYETQGFCFRPMAILESLAGSRAEELKNCLICKIGSYRSETRE